ncbi:hypothetical protein LINGRAHAP2_LOCUS12907 [Linum grandiflorum]
MGHWVCLKGWARHVRSLARPFQGWSWAWLLR